MQRRPRPPSKPILSREQITWLVFLGLIMAIGTLSVVSWAEQAHCAAVAHTMGMVTLAHFTCSSRSS
jgi:Ca2+-transporting ATPase